MYFLRILGIVFIGSLKSIRSHFNRTICGTNEFSIKTGKIEYVENLWQNKNVITVRLLLWTDNFKLYSSLNHSFNLCISFNDQDGVCGLDPIEEHHFEIPSTMIINSSVVVRICENGQSSCFCSIREKLIFGMKQNDSQTLPSYNLKSFEIIAPHSNQILSTDYLIFIAQLQKSFFQSYTLCIIWHHNNTTIDLKTIHSNDDNHLNNLMSLLTYQFIDKICYDKYPDSVFSSANRTLLNLLELQEGFWRINISSIHFQNRTVFESLNISFYISPHLSSSSTSPTPDHSQHTIENDSSIRPQYSTLLLRRRLADSTYFIPQEEDLHRIRLYEHKPDVYIPIEANETHNGTARPASVLHWGFQPGLDTTTAAMTAVDFLRRIHSLSPGLSIQPPLPPPPQLPGENAEVTCSVIDEANKDSEVASIEDSRTMCSRTPPSLLADPLFDPHLDSIKVYGHYVGVFGDIEVDSMSKETAQRDAVSRVLTDMWSSVQLEEGAISEFPDIVLVSDTDEIIRNEVIKDLRSFPFLTRSSHHVRSTANHPQQVNEHTEWSSLLAGQRESHILFTLDHFLYNFNHKLESEWGIAGLEGAYATPSHILLDKYQPLVQTNENKNTNISNSNVGRNHGNIYRATRLRRIFRAEFRDTLLSLAREVNIVVWKQAGWHLSSFKPPAVQALFRSSYPKETNPAFWSEERCALIQRLGVSHIAFRPNHAHSIDDILANTVRTFQYFSNSSDHIPLLLQRDPDFLSKFVNNEVLSLEDSRSILKKLFDEYDTCLGSSGGDDNGKEGNQSIGSSISYHPVDPSQKGLHTFTFRCLDIEDAPGGHDSSPRRCDLVDVYGQLCCDKCPLGNFPSKDEMFRDVSAYVDTLCRISSNPTVEANIILPSS